MQGYFAVSTVVLLVVLVLSRIILLNKLGIRAFKFGGIDKKDFLIPPFALFFLYMVIASVFNLPKPGVELFSIDIIHWVGVLLCMAGLILFLLGLISFGKSFRVGIDENHPGTLVTTGVFAKSRNPIYTAFGLIIVGIFLIIPNWILLLYVVLGLWLFNRQVLREEDSLKRIYGEEYTQYCKKVRRYF